MKVTELEVYMISDKKDFGKYTIRRTSMDSWQIRQGSAILFEGDEYRVSKRMSQLK